VDEVEPDLTEVQKAYNVAASNMFQLAAYGHHRYHPSGEALTSEGKRQQRDYNNRLSAAREELEAAVLRLVAEHAEIYHGRPTTDWLRALADDPAQLSLLVVRPDERDFDTQPACPPIPPCPECGMKLAIIRMRLWPWRRQQWWRCYGCFIKYQADR
jgi:hypothetical protein